MDLNLPFNAHGTLHHPSVNHRVPTGLWLAQDHLGFSLTNPVFELTTELTPADFKVGVEMRTPLGIVQTTEITAQPHEDLPTWLFTGRVSTVTTRNALEGEQVHGLYTQATPEALVYTAYVQATSKRWLDTVLLIHPEPNAKLMN